MPSRRLCRESFACFPRLRVTDVSSLFLLQVAKESGKGKGKGDTGFAARIKSLIWSVIP
jgi:hypothetical protein